MNAVGGRVVDVPALIDAATGRTQYLRAWLTVMTRYGHTIAVPSTVRSRAAEQFATAGELAELDWFFEGAVLEIPLAAADALNVDTLARDRFRSDVAVAHAALIAWRRGWPVITSEQRAVMFEAAGIEAEPLP